MFRNRYHRTLVLALIVASLVVLPVSVDAAPRDGERDAGTFDVLVSAWDWISNLWGAGGGNWDPNRTPSPADIGGAPPLEAGLVTVDRVDRSGGGEAGAPHRRAALR